MISESIPLTCIAGMFTAGQLPNNVNPANAMIVCDDNGCRPNALGKVYINAGTTYPPTH